MEFRAIWIWTFLLRLALSVAAAAAISIGAPSSASAANPLLGKVQGSSSTEQPGSLSSFLEQARKAGSTVIVVQPDQPKAVGRPATIGMSLSSTTLLQARANIIKMLQKTDLFVIGLPAILKSAGTDGTTVWFWQALATAFW
jgi:hypothetical protein